MPIFAKIIRPKYFQKSRMILSNLCNGDDKICEKKLFVLLRYKCIPKLSHSIFFGDRSRCNSGKAVFILSVAPTVSCATEQNGYTQTIRRPFCGIGA